MLHVGSDAREFEFKSVDRREGMPFRDNINRTAKSFAYNCRIRNCVSRDDFALSWLKDDLTNTLHSIFSVQLM